MSLMRRKKENACEKDIKMKNLPKVLSCQIMAFFSLFEKYLKMYVIWELWNYIHMALFSGGGRRRGRKGNIIIVASWVKKFSSHCL